MPLRLTSANFPELSALRRGEGTITLQASGTTLGLTAGSHQLLFRNHHLRDKSVYLANVLIPQSPNLAVTRQRREGDQRELVIDFVANHGTTRWPPGWFAFGVVVCVAVIGLARWRRAL